MSKFLDRIQSVLDKKRERNNKGRSLLVQLDSLMCEAAQRYPDELAFERNHGRPRLFKKETWKSPLICEGRISRSRPEQVELEIHYRTGKNVVEGSTIDYLSGELVEVICHWIA